MLTGKIIRKHVAVIHAYSRMSALQRKIFNVLLHEAFCEHNQINSQNSVAVECRISFSNLSKAVYFNSNNKNYLKESIDDLASLKIEWNLLKDKVPTEISFLNLRILHGSPTFYQDGTFNYSLHKVLIDLATNPSVYGTIDLDLQAQFESKYGHSLYENSTRFVNLHKGKVIQLDTFRKLLGVDAEKYPSMREFTRNVINPAVEEVNDRAEFVVSLNGIKAGRKITGYELIVTPKKRMGQSQEAEDGLDINHQLFKDIKTSFGSVGETVINNIFSSYDEEYILEKISYTKRFAKKNTDGVYPIAYLMSALKMDYKTSGQLVEPSHDKQEQGSSVLKNWAEEEKILQREIAHWTRLVSWQPTDNNKKILAECEEKLRKHYLHKPIIDEERG